MTIRLAIIDGHPLIRHGLSALANSLPDIEVVAEWPSAAAATQMLRTTAPDVIITAVDLPDDDGLRLASELREANPDLGIVILTARNDDELLFRSLEAGVSGFVVKTAPVEEVLAMIRHAAVAPTSFASAGLRAALERRRTAQQRLLLSPREAEVLSLLGKGMSIPAIAQSMFISPSTAKTYVARLYEKLGVTNRAHALMMGMHHGLVTWQPAPPAGAATARKLTA